LINGVFLQCWTGNERDSMQNNDRKGKQQKDTVDILPHSTHRLWCYSICKDNVQQQNIVNTQQHFKVTTSVVTRFLFGDGIKVGELPGTKLLI
jgi:hypothetical protein